MKKLLNFALMQGCWFACVLGAANGIPWLGVGVAAVVAAMHLLMTTNRAVEAKLLGASLLLGFAIDSTLASTGVITFRSGAMITGITTPWMLGLWLGFATSLTSSLRALIERPAIAIVFGAIGGPLAYWSGAKLGALAVGSIPISLIAIGACWAIAMTCFSILVRRLHGHSIESEAVA